MGLTVTDAGSFRDPSGQVHLVGGRIFRTIMQRAADDFEFARSTGLIEQLISSGQLIPETIVDNDTLGAAASGVRYVLEHPRLPFISYPYEWPFAALKAAALHHLDVHLTALDYGVTLSDASAYNIQFRGAKPVFIDSLSFRRYQEGEFWLGHRQFCEQFLNPLLLGALVGLPHNGWYRGEMEGISAESLCRVLPVLRKLSPNVLTHVVLQARFQAQGGKQKQAERMVKERRLPLVAFKQMLKGLRKWIFRLEPHGRSSTVWKDYAIDNRYAPDEAQRKREFISEFCATIPKAMLWDIGCNTGDYAGVALAAGVDAVVGFDFDQGALEIAFSRAKAENLNFLPLFLDAANPPPSQGWAQGERLGLGQRANADALMALALIHHLAIGRNIQLPAAVDWLVGLAPVGVIEFVQKTDPMVQTLLQLREDIFDDYSEETFLNTIQRRADIVHVETVSANGRRLFWYTRHDHHDRP
jgi:ribosomal protein L11 methylase PrmA